MSKEVEGGTNLPSSVRPDDSRLHSNIADDGSRDTVTLLEKRLVC